MSELKARHAFDVYEEYTKTANDEQAQVYIKSEADKVIAELKKAKDYWNERAIKNEMFIAKYREKLESVQASAYAESVDADMRERRLRRALWVTRANFAKAETDRWESHIDCGNKRNRKDPAFVKTGKLLFVGDWRILWAKNERKCRAMAEEYK